MRPNFQCFWIPFHFTLFYLDVTAHCGCTSTHGGRNLSPNENSRWLPQAVNLGMRWKYFSPSCKRKYRLFWSRDYASGMQRLNFFRPITKETTCLRHSLTSFINLWDLFWDFAKRGKTSDNFSLLTNLIVVWGRWCHRFANNARSREKITVISNELSLPNIYGYRYFAFSSNHN